MRSDGFDQAKTIELCNGFPPSCREDLKKLVIKEHACEKDSACVGENISVLNPESVESCQAAATGINRKPSMDCAFVLVSEEVVLSEFKLGTTRPNQIPKMNLPEKVRQTKCLIKHHKKRVYREAYFIFDESIKDIARNKVSRLFLAENDSWIPKNAVVSMREFYSAFFG